MLKEITVGTKYTVVLFIEGAPHISPTKNVPPPIAKGYKDIIERAVFQVSSPDIGADVQPATPNNIGVKAIEPPTATSAVYNFPLNPFGSWATAVFVKRAETKATIIIRINISSLSFFI